MYPDDLKYTAEHEWVRVIGDGADAVLRLGITDYAQEALGDIVFVTLPAVGTDVELGQAVSSLFESGLFADVNITLQGQSLVVQVVENPIINRVIFEGDRALKEDKLRDEVTAKPRGVA